MKNKKYIYFILIVVCVFLNTAQSIAQCAMCKTSVESDLDSGKGSIATGLNTGILYLMAIPYLILMAGGYIFFRKQVDAKIKELRNKMFFKG